MNLHMGVCSFVGLISRLFVGLFTYMSEKRDTFTLAILFISPKPDFKQMFFWLVEVDSQAIRSTTQAWVVTSHQYKMSTLIS